MDPLSDVLELLEPRSYLTGALAVGGDWAIRFDNRPGTIKCYAVTEGRCCLSVDGIPGATGMAAGDCFVLPNGRSFELASAPGLVPVAARDVFGAARSGGVTVHNGGGAATFVGTRFEVDRRQAEALLGALPPVLRLRAAEDQAALRWSIERMMTELREARAGAALASHHLAHLMLLQVLRLHLSQQTVDRVGWLYALGDPRLGAVIHAMHALPARRWTLEALSERAGLSRSVLAQRFRERVGETPIAYLTRWRMVLAAERLGRGNEPLPDVARSVGYGSENAFGTAFKRVMGCPPGRYVRAGTTAPSGTMSGSGDRRGPDEHPRRVG